MLALSSPLAPGDVVIAIAIELVVDVLVVAALEVASLLLLMLVLEPFSSPSLSLLISWFSTFIERSPSSWSESCSTTVCNFSLGDIIFWLSDPPPTPPAPFHPRCAASSRISAPADAFGVGTAARPPWSGATCVGWAPVPPPPQGVFSPA